MNSENRHHWWDIFKTEMAVRADVGCPAVPVNSGRAWQKGLATLYCPCKPGMTASECLPALG